VKEGHEGETKIGRDFILHAPRASVYCARQDFTIEIQRKPISRDLDDHEVGERSRRTDKDNAARDGHQLTNGY
jgi:hypothetical protein